MKVYLDCSPLTNAHISGIGVYTKNLFLELEKLVGDSTVVPVLKLSRFGKREIVKDHLQKTVELLSPIVFDKNILYHGPDYKINAFLRGPKVVTIHDMQPFVNKWMDAKFAARKRAIIEATLKGPVDKIIAISEFTKEEILKLYPKLAPKIKVVYHGCHFASGVLDANPEGLENRIERAVAGRPFLFFIGNIEERKNLVNQIHAFHLLKKDFPDLLFVIAGNRGFNSESVFRAIEASAFKDSILVFSYLNEREKQFALRNTQCLMFASWYEGFGIPVIEALAFGANVLISKTEALMEIAGDICHSADPADVHEMALQTALIMKKGNKGIVDGEEWKRQWTWKKTAEETLVVYRECE